MFFKPRLFISSTLDLKEIRNKINSFFVDVGAETLMYEKNLTPSITKSTYRKDILDADFVIIILDKRYGTKTELDLSGTHEEWIIANEESIPCHVYINKDSEKDESLNDLINELNNNQISYYYYENDDDLLSQIKSTTFTIAQEIIYQNIQDYSLDSKTSKKIIHKFEYKKAINIIKIFKKVFSLEQKNKIDFIRTTILDSVYDQIDYIHIKNGEKFYDQKINDKFNNMIVSLANYTSFHSTVATSINNYEIKFNKNTLYISDLETNFTAKEGKKLRELLNEFIRDYKGFYEYVQKVKLEIDIL